MIKKMKRINLAVIFGAKSLEHEVSIVTAFQAWEWLDPSKYNRFLIYLDSQNQAFLCSNLKKEDYHDFLENTLHQNKRIEFVRKGILLKRGLFGTKIKIDVALLSMHGAYGEDGRIQGMLDFYDIPYTGSGVLGSALKMNKVVQKDIFIKMGLRVSPYEWFWDKEFMKNKNKILESLGKKLRYPMFVKPANGGSSIGVTKVEDRKTLEMAVKKVSELDHQVLVEEGVRDVADINCAILGGYEPIASVCEQPISEDKFLSFKEKYLKGGKTKGMAGLSRIIPAPIPEKASLMIQNQSKLAFRELGCWGVARMDFLFQKKTGKVFANEINTIPGSFAFYLWEASGIKPEQLMDKLIFLALERKKELENLDYSFKSEILDQK